MSDTERPPLQEQIDSMSHELRLLNVELGFAMRYIRVAAQALGAINQVRAIDAERDEWRESNGYEEETRPGRLKVAEGP